MYTFFEGNHQPSGRYNRLPIKVNRLKRRLGLVRRIRQSLLPEAQNTTPRNFKTIRIILLSEG